VIAGQQRLQKDGTLVRIIDPSKGQAAANAPAGGAANAAGAAPGNAPGGPNAGKPAESIQAKGAEKVADKGKSKMPPVTGENPCVRGLNAAR
jgi:membrane fusion protein (multidrug efflux system)